MLDELKKERPMFYLKCQNARIIITQILPKLLIFKANIIAILKR